MQFPRQRVSKPPAATGSAASRCFPPPAARTCHRGTVLSFAFVFQVRSGWLCESGVRRVGRDWRRKTPSRLPKHRSLALVTETACRKTTNPQSRRQALTGACQGPLDRFEAATLRHSLFLVADGGLKTMRQHQLAMMAGDLTTRPDPWGQDEASRLMHTLRDACIQVSGPTGVMGSMSGLARRPRADPRQSGLRGRRQCGGADGRRLDDRFGALQIVWLRPLRPSSAAPIDHILSPSRRGGAPGTKSRYSRFGFRPPNC